jgi:Cu2+-exporting ATPase
MTAHVTIRPEPRWITSDITVEGMHCAACIAKIERALLVLPDVASARVNLSTRRLRVVHAPSVAIDTLVTAVEGIGFPAHVFAGEHDLAADRERRRLMQALAVAGFAAMNIMLLSVSVWSGADGTTRSLFHWLSAAIALPTVAFAGRPFFASAWSAVRHGRTNMDVPISIGVILTTLMSLYETATGGAHAYFDGAVMLLFFLLAGRFLDSTMRAKARDSVTALLRRVPSDTLVLAPDGASVRTPVADLTAGMRVVVAAGERVPADGVIESGASVIDRALVTGESAPEPVETGAAVLAGTINMAAPLVVRITKAGDDTAIADIARLMESAHQVKSRYVKIADRASRLYAPAVHTLALLSFAGWLLAGAALHQAASVGVAVLIITCPCALGLAVPIAQVVASGALMRAGILVKEGTALERLATVDTVILDKTGTTTLGRVVPVRGMPEDADAISVLLTLASASIHPLSRAIAIYARQHGGVMLPVWRLTEHAGLGLDGDIAGVSCRLGRPDWVGEGAAMPPGDGTAIAYRIGERPIRIINFQDEVRTDALQAVERLRRDGCRIELLSGDSSEAVGDLAARLGLAGQSRMSPTDKYHRILDLQRLGRRVLMVGDGLNDGPALKAADVAMAPGTASDVGALAADIVFLGELLMPVPLALAAARRTQRVVRQNFALAIGYNAIAVPLAMAGLVTPLIAALAMSGSSLLVVANALRLRAAVR